MESKYDTYNHSKFSIRYHIILSVKYHKKILRFFIDDLKKSFISAQDSSHDWKIEKMETDLKNGKDHHIHFMIKSKPTVAPYEIISLLKRYSTVEMWRYHEDVLKRNFGTGKHLLWSRGYFCCSIGNASKETIAKYIEEH